MSVALVCKEVALFDKEIIITGGGIAGAFHAYDAYCQALKKSERIKIRIYEKNGALDDTTTANIVPSLTCDEILSVVPRGKLLIEKLTYPFNERGGIRVDDVSNVNDSIVSQDFISQAELYSQDESGYQERTKILLALGKMSMDLWQKAYDEADDEFKEILQAANYNPCREISPEYAASLHQGYRIDLIYNIENAQDRASDMIADYQKLGYAQCRLLSPAEVMAIDPFLADFCKEHAMYNQDGTLIWRTDSVAIWRPGGCIYAKELLPRLYEYLTRKMGTYIDSDGNEQRCFQIFYNCEVRAIDYELIKDQAIITGIVCNHESSIIKSDNNCQTSLYIFCPGEAVGTLKKLGFKEPAYAGFAGVSLQLTIPISEDKIEVYKTFNHCMEVHQEGVVLAWQARFLNGNIFIGVAGTKAFYGDQQPTKDHAFAKDRNLLQLNMINNVLPEFISLALGRDTKGCVLAQADMDRLEQHGIARRWAGVRAVVFDGFPTLGSAYIKEGYKVTNALITTHLGSGGASFGPAAVYVSNASREHDTKLNVLVKKVLAFAQSNRYALNVSVE